MKKLVLAILALLCILLLIHFIQFYPLRYAQHVLEGKERRILVDTDEDGLPDIKELGYPPGFPATNYTNPDTDGDGIPDGWEVKYRSVFDMDKDKYQPSDPNRADSDSDFDTDGLTNYEEYRAGTNPGNNDTDSDSMFDGWEVRYGLNPLVNDSLLDADSDGLLNLEEYLAGTNPKNSDTDGDGLGDYDEIRTYGTNPTNPDTDSDGMPDGWEVYYLLNPLDATDAELDSDEDELKNREEYSCGTNPRNRDTDTDGMPDGWEVYYNLNPLLNDSYIDNDLDNLTNLEEYLYQTNPKLNDTDGDWISDGDEVKFYYTDPTNPDTDGDGLSDGEEIFLSSAFPELYRIYEINSTNPLTMDTDDDGLSDYEEVFLSLAFPTISKLYNISFTNPCAKDTDNDALNDYEEVYLRACFLSIVWRYPDVKPTNPCNNDSDNDALSDGNEVEWLTHPNNLDTDTDGMPDGWEVNYAVYKVDVYYWNIDPRRNDADCDSDNDALPNLQEYLFNIPDNWNVSLNGVWWDGTNPINWDSDSDRMPDGYETFYSFNPLFNDSFQDYDNDAMSNLQEYLFNITNEWNVSLHGVWWNGTDPTNWDSDDDSMPDGWEVRYALNPLGNDSYQDKDNDILTNLEEYQFNLPQDWNVTLNGVWWNGTEPTNWDTDSDSMPDGWEVFYSLNPLNETDGSADRDGDNLTNLNEYLVLIPSWWNVSSHGVWWNGTSPLNPDCDCDDLLDGDEIGSAYPASEIDWDGDGNLNYNTNPLSPDTDRDTFLDGYNLIVMSNSELYRYFLNYSITYIDNLDGTVTFYGELTLGTNPLVKNETADTDRDGLTNWEELNIYHTNPNNPDTDGDWLWDGDELGLVEKDGYPNIYITNPLKADTDGNGSWDGWEVIWGFDPTNPNDDDDDADKEGLTNRYEFWITQTSPRSFDTDKDRLLDGYNITVNIQSWQGEYIECDYNITQTAILKTIPNASELYNSFMAYGILYNRTNNLVIFIGELSISTNPLSNDTDNDNYTDTTEVESGTDPTNSTSYPPPPQYSTTINITSVYPKKDVYYIGEQLNVTGFVKNVSDSEYLSNVTVKIYLRHNETGILYEIGSGTTNATGWFNITCTISQNVAGGEFTLVAKALPPWPYQESWVEEIW